MTILLEGFHQLASRKPFPEICAALNIRILVSKHLSRTSSRHPAAARLLMVARKILILKTPTSRLGLGSLRCLRGWHYVASHIPGQQWLDFEAEQYIDQIVWWNLFWRSAMPLTPVWQPMVPRQLACLPGPPRVALWGIAINRKSSGCNSDRRLAKQKVGKINTAAGVLGRDFFSRIFKLPHADATRYSKLLYLGPMAATDEKQQSIINRTSRNSPATTAHDIWGACWSYSAPLYIAFALIFGCFEGLTKFVVRGPGGILVDDDKETAFTIMPSTIFPFNLLICIDGWCGWYNIVFGFKTETRPKGFKQLLSNRTKV